MPTTRLARLEFGTFYKVVCNSTSNEVKSFFLWESAAADRDDRGWKPLPQGRHFIAY